MRSWGFAFPSGFPVLFFLQKFFVGGFRSDIRFVGPCDGWVERGEHRAFLRWGGFEALIILITTIEHFSIFHNYNYLAVFATRSFWFVREWRESVILRCEWGIQILRNEYESYRVLWTRVSIFLLFAWREQNACTYSIGWWRGEVLAWTLNSRRIITMPGQGLEYRASGRLIRSRKYSDEEGELPTNYTNLHERKLAVGFLWLRR